MSETAIKCTYHGEDGFGDLKHDDDDATLDGLVQAENAVVAMNRIVSEHQGE